ncbi:MAG: hypothetical protein HN657_03590 [Candidatus Marinimicrobia bacterium]|jgi:hypothetical protein|nr:hypothetical protein [Candidatus Neomarinimicrobiota bacterium]MBT3496908.1 hypothetical protein [Candidatus Neomarinimicrobiota bacterium]MBT3692364.1 hypothetical protein [Candidatus Neomarinimicrobiota bacterium]MBT3732545.1 hypothetical protein [Candidatus Neomarinimicrobiota bacterium]MBT4143871.1 hypothetical protein [Candidatus Neomarinimicrobiota bacterium]
MKQLFMRIAVSLIFMLAVSSLFADVDSLFGKCTLPKKAGINITVSATQGGTALLSAITNPRGRYSVNCGSLSAGTYFFYVTDGLGSHLWQFYYSGTGDISHDFSLSV